ncbi:hypothetical protein GQ53DRAFT_819418 [Thozetella sp. PMI_491]|nr:hypothetical protein GQ53DRAFT_819418 [Thozetella sp. PMI_491]
MEPSDLAVTRDLMPIKSKADQLLTWLFPGDKAQALNVERDLVFPDVSDNASVSSSMQAEASSSACGEEDEYEIAEQWDQYWDHATRSDPFIGGAAGLDTIDSLANLLGAGSLFDELQKMEDQESVHTNVLDSNVLALSTETPSKSPSINPTHGKADSLPTNISVTQLKAAKPNSNPGMLWRQEMEPADFYRKYVQQHCITGSETEPSMADSSRESRGTMSTIESLAPRKGQVRRRTHQGSLSESSESQIDLEGDKANASGGVDRLAILFDRETISLLGSSELLRTQNPNFDGHMSLETTHAFQADVSTLKYFETATAGSKDASWDEENADDWLSDLTEDDQILEASHPFLKHREELLLSALRRFRSHIAQCKGGTPTQGHQEPAADNKTGQQNIQSAKRRLSIDDSLNSGSTPFVGRQPPKKRKASAVNQERTLACLFYKHNKIQHIDCLRHTLRRVKDVKQHLWRKHRQPQLYCPICYQVFTSRPHHDFHIQSRNCMARDRPIWDGISENLREELSRRVEAGISEEEQWFSVWDVVFPGEDRPRTAYLKGQLEELIEMLREYWGASGQEVISTVLAERGLLNWDMLSEERDLSILLPQLLRDLISTILDQFLASSAQTIGQIPPTAEDAMTPADPLPNVVSRPLPTPAPSNTSGTHAVHTTPLPAAGGSDPAPSLDMLADLHQTYGPQEDAIEAGMFDHPLAAEEVLLDNGNSDITYESITQEAQGILEDGGVFSIVFDDLEMNILGPSTSQQGLGEVNDENLFTGF